MELTSSGGQQLPRILPGPGPLRENRPLTKTKKSSVACLPCKRAKRKCTGRPDPCKACKATGGECVFNENLDLRRKIAAHKAQTDLERYQNMLWGLLEYMRVANEERIEHLLGTIRAGGNLEQNIAQVLREAIVEESSIDETVVDASDTSSDNDRSSRIKVENLSDNPLFRVPCKPWTEVTDDDHVVSNLISLYFTWDHPLLQVVDQEMFLRFMGAGDMNSDYCSPLLVNSVLAVASTYQPDGAYTIPGDVVARGQRFFAEAESLWKVEEGQPSLTNIQALALMSHTLKLQGKDNASWLYLRQAVQLGQDIGVFNIPMFSHKVWDQMSDHTRRASARTAWTIFILNSQLSMESRITANLGVPRLSLDMIDHPEKETNWIPYQIRSNEFTYIKKPALLRDVMAGLADLTKTVVEMQDLFFDKALDLEMSIHELCKEASLLHNRLRKFLDSMAIIETPPVPQILFLHMKCHQVIAALFGFLLEHRDFKSSSQPSVVEEVELFRKDSALQVAHYLQLYREYHDPQQTPSLMLGPATSSALALLPFLTDESINNVFFELYHLLEAFSERFPAAKAVLWEIDAHFRNSSITSPVDGVVVGDSDS
ncbi:fungal-specific transcription factor domain-containing protein [Aspergillus crustosus]